MCLIHFHRHGEKLVLWAIVSTNGQKRGNFHRRTKHCRVEMNLDMAKFDNCTHNEKSIFPWNFTTIFWTRKKVKKCENYFLREKIIVQLKENEAGHWSGFHHSPFSATAIFPARICSESTSEDKRLIKICWRSIYQYQSVNGLKKWEENTFIWMIKNYQKKHKM